mmetsp:Transcript_12584/g.12659  ORF Transcript_12584/g.12659 Transcript_12584/m.12659 type:complete len:228 (-) Transcript_12584:23-706(-)
MILVHALLWFAASHQTHEVAKIRVFSKVTSIEWVSCYLSFTYFLLAFMSTFNIRFLKIKQELLVSIYLMTLSLLCISLILKYSIQMFKLEEIEEDYEYVKGISEYYLDIMTGGGLLGLVLYDMKFIEEFAVPSSWVLLIFDVYLGGWYCFMQFLFKKSAGSFSYQFLNEMSNEQLILLGLGGIGLSAGIKQIILNLNKVEVDAYREKKAKEDARIKREREANRKKYN